MIRARQPIHLPMQGAPSLRTGYHKSLLNTQLMDACEPVRSTIAEPRCQGQSHDSGYMGCLWNFPQRFWIGRCSYCNRTFRRYGFNDWREYELRTDAAPGEGEKK